MTKHAFALAAAALALGPASLWAAAGDAWYGTNRPATTVQRVEIAPAPPPSVITYEETVSTVPVYVEPYRAPVVVQREVYVANAPRDVVIVGPTYSTGNVYDPLFPQRGPWIDHGLFNSKGPNDFGS